MSKSSKKTSARRTVSKAAAKAARRSSASHIIKVLKKENPFTAGTARFKRAAAVLAANGKPIAVANEKGGDSWTVRYLEEAKIIAVKAA